MKTPTILLFKMTFVLIHNIIFAQTPANDLHWQLKWQDNFSSFNSTKWIKVHNCDHGGEPQLFLEENVWVSNGNLVIEVNNIPKNCPLDGTYPISSWCCGKCQEGKHNYTTGWVETKDAFRTQYGYIEARMKLPFIRKNSKSWGIPIAFWTWRSDQPSSNVAEIDIFEMFSGEYKAPNTLNTCIHTCYDPGCDKGMGRSHTYSNFDYRDWHTYAIEWNANRIIWYLDGKAIRTLSNHGIVDPIRIIMGLGIDKKHLPPTSPTFHEYMYVDYVKVYCLQCDKNTVVNEISNFSNYNYAVKKSISLSNATAIPANSNITLRATDFIELKAGFEVQTGRELYLDVTPCEPCIPIAQEIPRGGGE